MEQKIYCPIRRGHVAALPEELIRQRLLHQMIHALGYPASMIVVEKELRLLPHISLTDQKIPTRRADILCFGKGIHPQYDLYPLLLVECKAVPLTAKVINQVVGYNRFVRSYYVAIANGDEVKTGWYNPQSQQYDFVEGLPSYAEAIAFTKRGVQTGF